MPLPAIWSRTWYSAAFSLSLQLPERIRRKSGSWCLHQSSEGEVIASVPQLLLRCPHYNGCPPLARKFQRTSKQQVPDRMGTGIALTRQGRDQQTGASRFRRPLIHLSMKHDGMPSRSIVEARILRFLGRGVYPEPSRRAPWN